MRLLKVYELLLIKKLSLNTDFHIYNDLSNILVEEPFPDLPTIRSDKTPLGTAVYRISSGYYFDIDKVEVNLTLLVDENNIFGELDYWKVNDEKILSFPASQEDIYLYDD